MSDKRTKALIKAAQYINDCYDLGITAEEVIAFSKVLTIPSDEPESKNEIIEKGKEKRDTFPTPLLESKEKGKEIPPLARAREDLEAFRQLFDAFWSAYPVGHKIAKKKCFAALRSRFNAAKDPASGKAGMGRCAERRFGGRAVAVAKLGSTCPFPALRPFSRCPAPV